MWRNGTNGTKDIGCISISLRRTSPSRTAAVTRSDRAGERKFSAPGRLLRNIVEHSATLARRLCVAAGFLTLLAPNTRLGLRTTLTVFLCASRARLPSACSRCIPQSPLHDHLTSICRATPRFLGVC